MTRRFSPARFERAVGDPATLRAVAEASGLSPRALRALLRVELALIDRLRGADHAALRAFLRALGA